MHTCILVIEYYMHTCILVIEDYISSRRWHTACDMTPAYILHTHIGTCIHVYISTRIWHTACVDMSRLQTWHACSKTWHAWTDTRDKHGSSRHFWRIWTRAFKSPRRRYLLHLCISEVSFACIRNWVSFLFSCRRAVSNSTWDVCDDIRCLWCLSM